MTAVHWVLIGLVALIAAFGPVTTAASPSPSPALSFVLAPAPGSDYAEADATSQTVMEGAFSAQQYASKTSSANQSEVQSSLERNGFVAGYGRTWIQQSTQHVLIEAVIAFNGGLGAKRWLAAAQLSDKGDPKYQHPISVPGISNYYGAHMAGNGLFTDTFGMVKGNDYFWVITISRQDDLGNAGATQAKAQFDFAPAQTIPTSMWPESTRVPGGFDSTSFISRLTGDLLLIAFILSFIVLLVAVIRRAFRRPKPPSVIASTIQLSPDGNFWWDGTRWKDSSREAPPWAQRSSDHNLWWDGRHWRPVPKARV
jgi:uncharacterized membrane protein